MQSVTQFMLCCALLAARVVSGQSLICAVDLNGNGQIDPGEQATCATYSSGALCPIDAQHCVVGTAGTPTCPGAPTQPCIATGNGVYSCSPHACMDPSTIAKTVTSVNSTPQSNAGAVSSAGACLGTLYIFPGKASTCRNVGVETAFTNCCSSSNAMKDTMGSQNQISVLSTNLSTVEKQIVDHCTPNDEATDFQVNSGQCINLGNYCAQSWPLVGCVQSARSYCCFNSMLARIIQQQGRPQIPSMGGFGTATSPNCNGFTVQQFQALDFSKIDLSEYTAQLQTNSQANMENTVNGIATQQLSSH